MAAEKIYWQEKVRQVYDRTTGKMKSLKVHRLNVNHEYNFGMGGADIANQIRGSYRFDHWLRWYKWWHSIFWWGVQVLMTNSYKCYRRCHEIEGLHAMTHYEYQTKIACAWLDHTYFDNVRTGIPSSQSVSSLSTTNTVDTQRRTRVSDCSFDPLKMQPKAQIEPCTTSLAYGINKSTALLSTTLLGYRQAYISECGTMQRMQRCCLYGYVLWTIPYRLGSGGEEIGDTSRMWG